MGGQTMFIYICHPYILDLLKYFVRNSMISNKGVFLYLYSIGIIASLLLLSNVKFFRIILNPIGALLRKHTSN